MLKNSPMPYRDFAMWLRGVLEMNSELKQDQVSAVLAKLDEIEKVFTDSNAPVMRC